MSTSVAVAPGASAQRPRRSGAGLLVGAAVLLAVAPFLLSALDVLGDHRGVALGGDQAVLELDTREAAQGGRSLGAYSRYGWSHPGPAWFYALAPVYRALGSTSTALYVAVFAVHAAAAALLVLVVARTWGTARAVVAATAVAATWAVLGPGVFLAVWNPYALLLPTVLFLVLAAVAATGRPAALAGAALTGTFLVQTHIGTAVLVAAVGGCAMVGAVVTLVRRRGAAPAPAPSRPAAALLAVLTVLAWVPPLLQELRPGTGNLTLLRQFQSAPHDGHTLAESVAAVGSQLLVLPTGGSARALPELVTGPSPAQLWSVVVYALLALVLAGSARRAGRPATVALALLSLVALGAALVSAAQVEGPIYPYLVVWMAVLPLAPVLCAADLLLVSVARRGGPRLPAPARLVVAGTLPALALLAVVVVLAGAPPVSAESRFGEGAAVPEVLAALGPDRTGGVRVRIASSDSWPLAAGLVLALERRGYHARVTADWTYMFGPERGATGTEQREVVLVQEAGRATLPALPDARALPPVTSSLGTTYLLLRDPPGDAAVPTLPGPATGVPPA